MLTFVIELINWIRARKLRDKYFGNPYFWGSPDSQEGYDRYDVFLRTSGIKGEQ
jgi:hypothetical protein